MNRRIQGEPLENGSDLAGDVINNKLQHPIYYLYLQEWT